MSGALKRDEWKTVRLGDYISLIRGVSYSPKDVGDDSNSDYLPVLRANNIHDDMLNFDDLVYVHISKINNTQLIKSGDILVCASSGSKQLVGKSARATQDYQGSFGAFCKLVRTHDCIDSKYLGHYFGSEIYRRNISDLAQGANINNLRNEHIENILLPLPPLDVQRRIADTLDKVSELITLRKTQLEKLDELVKARFVELFGSIHDEKFEMKSLPEIVAKDKNAIKRGPFGGALKKEDFVETGYLVYEQRHAIHNDFEYEKYYITKEKYEDMIGFKVVPGDLIISCSGVTLGRIAEVPRGAKEGIINQALLKLSLNQTVMKNTFFIHQFRSEEIQEILFGFSRGSGIPNMPSMNEVKAVKFICPPIEQQEQFTAFVEQTDKSKVIIQQSLDTLETLKKSLMQEYFG